MKVYKGVLSIVFIIVLVASFGFSEKENSIIRITNPTQKEIEIAYFASGCFWCVEAIFESVKGVDEAVSGYAGGHTLNPTYETIGTGKTGHAETVAVYYNPKKLSFKTLVDVYYGSHNPTTVNGQHPDYGSQYRSIVFYQTADEKKIIEQTIAKLNKEKYNGKIATEVTEFTKFYKAENYHQDFERRNPNQGYVKAVSIPRLNKFKKQFPELLKKEK
ncbi:peptide-methionine (S)-S-oxide reductase MsrA [Polaribacter sp. MSW13]|uniref:Peptide methionine sulfoxide reductase MsrA n=1 Tax=Polaribacter marinus TaxID=2916838 RepID=A0A9X1VKS0_9FLAO|nr:peptide-methionine (S)-S-oxide reductase MsrA [Polaribacter marinus]MCI2228309.1 peptide-methionine (S)-S-oxide reductase MsrA [Polaribacter marinus]